jgi:hypothetical protein
MILCLCVLSSDTTALTWAQAIALLCTIPGISRRAAEIILGSDRTRYDAFPHCQPFSIVVRHVPGPSRKCGQEAQRKEPQRQPLALQDLS